jgi:hypothetical protein
MKLPFKTDVEQRYVEEVDVACGQRSKADDRMQKSTK